MSLSRQDIHYLGDELEARLRRLLGVDGADAVVTEFAVKHLRERGYNVAPANSKWEKKKDFMRRLGLTHHESVNRDVQLWKKRGGTVEVQRSPTGYLREILSNPAFDEFCQRHIKLTTN